MVGCKLLARVHESLMHAKGVASAFGGISVILAGDFAQLPPVTEKRLYAWVNTRSKSCATLWGQEVIMGKLLWLSFTTVVILTKVMRQAGSANSRFVDLLGRLREGRLLNEVEWQDAPTIVSDNACKDALNVLATTAYARRTGQDLHWYYSRD
ncbi:hypothetical protein K466DRAFT_459182, partial [Polyporus arcularius HHB13444]